MFVRPLAFVALLALALGCAPDTPLRPFALSSPESSGSDIIKAVGGATARSFRLEVGRSVVFEVGERQFQRFVRYTSSAPAVADVSPSGIIRALSEGSATITGTLGTTSEQAEVVVIPSTSVPPEVLAFTISPKFGATVPLRGSRQFTASASWSDNAARSVAVTYSATGGTVSDMGLYSAGPTAGVFLVVATCVCSMADTAFVTVGSGTTQLAVLRISPKAVTLQPGGTQQFTSVASWSTGDTTPPPRSYSATGGTVSATGAFNAPNTPGTYRVIVAHTGGTLRDTAVVTVSGVVTDTETPPPGNGTFGPGPNAPNWAGKRSYPMELFTSPVPVHPRVPNEAGFQGFQGFEDLPNSPSRVSYPTVNTPIGRKPVIQITYPGSTTNISASNQNTGVWPTNRAWSVRITGTWTGTLVFEKSADGGVSWSEIVMPGTITVGIGTRAATGTSTTVNGWWLHDIAIPGSTVFRVRATSWTSGVAVVSVGMRGGASPAVMAAGTFVDAPKRVYTRVLVFVDPNWTNGGNTGTKFFQFSKTQGNNHYTQIIGDYRWEANAGPGVFLQGPAFRNMTVKGPTIGQWFDVEFVLIANEAGVPNGIAQMWVNGTRYVNESDVLYFASGKVPGFTSFGVDPTYGGGHAPPPRDVYFQIAAWYRESAP